MPAANRSGVAHLPRKKIPPDLRSLARGHTAPCVKVLAGVVGQEAVSPAARVSAAGILLDRGWGKAQQDGNVQWEVRVTLRKIGGDED
jgi:hypothetical protein